MDLPKGECHSTSVMMGKHWFRLWWHHVITWTNVDKNLWCHMTSPGHHQLTTSPEAVSLTKPLMKFNGCLVNSLWPSHAIRRQGTESTLAQVMACCLTAPSHYLNQCWLIISKVMWHLLEGIIMRISEDTNRSNKIENYTSRITFRSPRGQWVKLGLTSSISTHCRLMTPYCHKDLGQHWLR